MLEQIGQLWPATPGYSRLGWSEPVEDDGKLKVTTSGSVVLTFAFNDRDEITDVLLEGGFGGVRAQEANEIPLAVKGLINNALANQTPVVVTYVDGEGRPHSSLRGSVCVFSPTQLAIWIRHADGGLPQAIVNNPNVSLLYNDRRAGATVNVMGRAHIATDEATRRKVFELGPEVEQTHDPHRHGVAVIIDVTRLQGGPGAGRGNFSWFGSRLRATNRFLEAKLRGFNPQCRFKPGFRKDNKPAARHHKEALNATYHR